MAESFVEKFLNLTRARSSFLCIGLDVDAERVPGYLLREDDWITRFLGGIIDATRDLSCAYKVNLAFYQALGMEGWQALKLTRTLAGREALLIADGKQADVGHSASAYARAMFDYFQFDAVTVNPYLGFDGVGPFLSYQDKAVFALCKTSNPSSGEFQDLPCQAGGQTLPLYQVVARKAVEWQKSGCCGLVVGATYPEELMAVRQIAKDLIILIPGVGEQGGDLEKAVAAGADVNGGGIVVNCGRSVLYASPGDNWREAARAQAEVLQHRINTAIAERQSRSAPSARAR